MDIKTNLAETVANWQTIGHPALTERFVLRNGKPFTAVKRIGRKLQDKNCYQNTLYRASTWHDGTKYNNVTYVEGFGYRPGLILIQHAWVGMGDNAVDVTWKDPLDCFYFGIPFNVDDATKETYANGYYGLLEGRTGVNYQFMFKRDPGLLDEVDALFPQYGLKEKFLAPAA